MHSVIPSTLFTDSVFFNFILDAGARNLKGIEPVNITFESPSIDTTERDVWPYAASATDYIFTTDMAGVDYYIASANAADVQDVYVFVLDENWDELVIKMTLTGQTPIRINDISKFDSGAFSFISENTRTDAFKCVRINKVINVDTISFAGDVAVMETSDFVAGVPQTTSLVRAYVEAGDNESLSSIYSVPEDHHLLVFSSQRNVLKKQAAIAEITPWVRRFDGVFREGVSVSLNTQGQSAIQTIFTPVAKIEPKSDIKVRADSSAAATKVSGAISGILVPNSLVDKALGIDHSSHVSYSL